MHEINSILKEPYPSRKASDALRKRLEDRLSAGGLAVGDKFPSDAELARMTGLSRDTVRRATVELTRLGWIERRHGLGTYVGPRVDLPLSRRNGNQTGRKRILGRVAVLGTWFWQQNIGWYTAGIMEGMEEAASEAQVSIELLGSRGADPLLVRRRLGQSHPDVLVCLLPRGEHAMIIAEAQRLEIPTLMTGTRLADIGLPIVREDGAQGARLAIQRLVAAGHRRIGLLAWTEGGAWIFERRRGYLEGLKAAGLEPDERLTLWLDREKGVASSPLEAEQLGSHNAEAIARYLDAQRPTALLSTAAGITFDLGLLIRANRLRVPAELSVVQFDQAFNIPMPELSEITAIALPVQEMGQQLIQLARRAIDGENISSPEPIPCSLIEGSTVSDLTRLTAPLDSCR